MPTRVDPRSRNAAAHGVGGFIATHEQCADGFEIVRNGRGKLHLLCSGCGSHTEYGAADTEQLRANGIEPEQAVRARRFKPERENLERWLPAPPALPWWVPNAYIAAVIAIGLAMIAFGVIRPGSNEGPEVAERDSGSEAPPPQTTPPAQPPVSAGAVATPAPAPEPRPARRRPPPPELDRVEVLGRFAVGMPPGWEGGTSGGAVVLAAPGEDAVLRVFLERGITSRQDLAREAAGFLADEHQAAKVSKPRRARLGDTRAVELVATYPGGQERATLFTAGGYSYLVLTEVRKGASSATRAASAAALRSVRPL